MTFSLSGAKSTFHMRQAVEHATDLSVNTEITLTGGYGERIKIHLFNVPH